MRVIELSIGKWRNFSGITLRIPEDAPLVCLVGDNGTGKSNILELISAAASRLGISPGFKSERGDPFAEDHSFEIVIQLTETGADLLGKDWLPFEKQGVTWDGVLRLRSERQGQTQKVEVTCGGVTEKQQALSAQLAQQVADALRNRQETHYLFLDADRAYPPTVIQPHQFAEALGIDWESPEMTRNRAYLPTRTMYEDWIRSFLAQESKEATRYYQLVRKSKQTESAAPEFRDHFESYHDSVLKVLPHLNYRGVDTEQRQLRFDSAGLELPFRNLSGGEREIAFLIGQIERFKLRRGLLLIDEPELHLNPDLLRTWISFLRDSVKDGQVWLSTHSLEAVEVTGPECTFVLERDPTSRIVKTATPLATRPVIKILSAAVGSPAFSLSRLRFVFIEGDRQGRERERFHGLYEKPTIGRFMEGGSCTEVVRKLAAVRELAAEANEHLHVGAIIDRDFRTIGHVKELEEQTSFHVLECHEVENLFLHPPALAQVLIEAGSSLPEAEKLVQQYLAACSDRFAGTWILECAAVRYGNPARPGKEIRAAAGGLQWQKIEPDVIGAMRALATQQPGALPAEQSAIAETLEKCATIYQKTRVSATLWKHCFGKEVLSSLPELLGLRDSGVLEQRVLNYWKSGIVSPPSEVQALRAYVDGL